MLIIRHVTIMNIGNINDKLIIIKYKVSVKSC